MTCCPAPVRCPTGLLPVRRYCARCKVPAGVRAISLLLPVRSARSLTRETPIGPPAGIHLTKDRECRSPRHCRSRAVQRDVFVGCGVGEAGDQLETGLADSWSDPIEKAQEPDRRVDRPFVDEPLHLLEDCCAFFVVELDRLLLEQLVDVGVTAIGVSAALDVERFHSGRRIAE